MCSSLSRFLLVSSHTKLTPYLFPSTIPPFINHEFFFLVTFTPLSRYILLPPLTLGLINVTQPPNPDPFLLVLVDDVLAPPNAAGRLRLPCTCSEVSWILVFWSFCSISEFQLPPRPSEQLAGTRSKTRRRRRRRRGGWMRMFFGSFGCFC